MDSRLNKELRYTKKVFTVEQKVNALVRIRLTRCSKAEIARRLGVAESTFRGWFKNREIVERAEAKYNELMSPTDWLTISTADDRKGSDSRPRFSVPGPSPVHVVGLRGPERNDHNAQEPRNQHPNSGLGVNATGPANPPHFNNSGLIGPSPNVVSLIHQQKLHTYLTNVMQPFQCQLYNQYLSSFQQNSVPSTTTVASATVPTAATSATAEKRRNRNEVAVVPVVDPDESSSSPRSTEISSSPSDAIDLSSSKTVVENSRDGTSAAGAFSNAESEALDLSTHSRNKCVDSTSKTSSR